MTATQIAYALVHAASKELDRHQSPCTEDRPKMTLLLRYPHSRHGDVGFYTEDDPSQAKATLLRLLERASTQTLAGEQK